MHALHGQSELPKWVLEHMEPNWFFVTAAMLFALGIIGLSPIRLETDIGSHGTAHVYLRRVVLVLIGGMLILGVGAWCLFWTGLGIDPANAILEGWVERWAAFLVAALVFGLLLRLGTQRLVMPRLSTFLRSLRVTQHTEQLSDIRTEIETYQAVDYAPASYYRDSSAVRCDPVFLGVAALDRKPIYMPLSDWYETNAIVVGATRYGKGITFQTLAEQAILRGDCVFLVDPKGDKYLPEILRQTCAQVDRRFFPIDLVDPAVPIRYAPFAGGSGPDRRSRFYEIMDLNDRGTDADHYKAVAREHLFEAFDLAPRTTLPALLAHADTMSGTHESVAKALSTIRARLREWESYGKLLPASGKGFSVERALTAGSVVYIRGSLDDAVLRGATRALIMEVIQEARRLHIMGARPAHLTLFIDELRFLVSDTVVKALATIAGFNADIVTAFQNFGDLLNPEDQRLDGDSVLQSVTVNSQLKYVFGGTDITTAKYVAEASGMIMKKIARFERTEINRSGGEVWARQRTLSDQEEPLIPISRVLALPPRVAALLRPKAVAEIISVAPIALEVPFPAPARAVSLADGDSRDGPPPRCSKTQRIK